jgi:TolB-like protein
VVASFVALAAVWLNVAMPGDASPRIVNNRVAVLPFRALDESAEYLASGITGSLMDHLSAYESIEVVPTSAMEPYRDGLPAMDSVILDLRAAIYVGGEVRQRGDEIQVSIQLTGAGLENIYNGNLVFVGSDVITITEQVIAAVRSKIALIAREVERRAIWFGTRDTIAARLTQTGVEVGESVFEHLGSSAGMSLIPELLARADSMYRDASRRDPRWARPHLNRGRLALTRVQICFVVKPCELRQIITDAVDAVWTGIRLDPENAEGYELLALLEWSSWQFGVSSDVVTLDRAEEYASAALVRAESKSSPVAYRVLSSVHLDRGEWEEANEASRAAFERDEFQRDVSQNLEDLFEASFNLRADSIASNHCRALIGLPAHSFRALYCELQLMAWSDIAVADVNSARDLVERYVADASRLERSTTGPLAELLLAMVMAAAADDRIGDKQKVHDLVTRIVAQHEGVPDRLLYAAGAMARLGAHAEARSYLTQYAAVGRMTPGRVSKRRWFDHFTFENGVLAPEERTIGAARPEG